MMPLCSLFESAKCVRHRPAGMPWTPQCCVAGNTYAEEIHVWVDCQALAHEVRFLITSISAEYTFCGILQWCCARP